MRITTFRGEKNLRELTSKLFQDLAPDRQERAEQALLRANPQLLASLTDVPVGTVLLVPDVITARPKIHRGTEQQPAADIARVDKELNRVIAADPTLKNLVGGIDKGALARENEAKALKAFTTADLEVAEQDLAALMDRLS